MSAEPPQSRSTRRIDALEKLRREDDVWVASAAGPDVLHAQATGFDPRTLAAEYAYLRITP